ncbi:MAG: hypothetical protein HYV42_01425 [Candidatus Magasanikbacteria bacterium]|nr:hypothetical protein [Candidatus Magasanikbacteria bacterium]
MPIVNFGLKKPLDQKVNQIIKKQGFTSKAEFFRFVVWHYLGEQNKQNRAYAEFATAAEHLSNTIRKKFSGKQLPSLQEQLADLYD